MGLNLNQNKLLLNACFSNKIKHLSNNYFSKDHTKLANLLGISVRSLYDYQNDSYIEKVKSVMPTNKFLANLKKVYNNSNETYEFLTSINIDPSDFLADVSFEDFKEKITVNISDDINNIQSFILGQFSIYYYNHENNTLTIENISIKNKITSLGSQLYATISWDKKIYSAKVKINNEQIFISFNDDNGYTTIINITKIDNMRVLSGVVAGVTYNKNSYLPITNKCLLTQVDVKVDKQLIDTVLKNETLTFNQSEINLITTNDDNLKIDKNVNEILKNKTELLFYKIDSYIENISSIKNHNIYYDMLKSEVHDSKIKLIDFFKNNNFTMEHGEKVGLTFLKNVIKYSNGADLLTTPNDNLRTSIYYWGSKKSKLYQLETINAAKKIKIRKVFCIRTNIYRNPNYLSRIVNIMLELYHSNVEIYFTYNRDDDDYLEIALTDDFAVSMKKKTNIISNVTIKDKKIKEIKDYFDLTIKKGNSKPLRELLMVDLKIKHRNFENYTEDDKKKIQTRIKKILEDKNYS